MKAASFTEVYEISKTTLLLKKKVIFLLLFILIKLSDSLPYGTSSEA